MNKKNHHIAHIQHFKILAPMVLACIVGPFFFMLGNADDSPGLSFLGGSLSFLFIMVAIHATHRLRRGILSTIILTIYGIIALLFPWLLIFDQEITTSSPLLYTSTTLGIILLTAARLRYKKIA